MDAKPIWIGNDHGGFELKNVILGWLDEHGISYVDVGTGSSEIVRYPHYAAKVAGAVSRGIADRGILICSTGIGMSMIANKYRNVQAALCTSTYMAKMTRRHNDANVLCLGGRITGWAEALDILEAWLGNSYEGGRHAISLGLIKEAEATMFNDRLWTGSEEHP